MLSALLALVAALVGVLAGAALTRRNERLAHTDRLLAEAINDLVRAISDAAGGGGQEAQRRYAGAASRVALHASPRLADALAAFQRHPNTGTDEGRGLLIEALQQARDDLGRERVSPDAASLLLFGNEGRAAMRRS